jgi:murein DD-endopeptidase MepM/ murein hydrolase activator NlpD
MATPHRTRRQALDSERRHPPRRPRTPQRTPAAFPSRRAKRGMARPLAFRRRGLAALLFAWLLAFTQGLPAYAAEPDSTTTRIQAPADPQTVIVADGTPATFTRDAFSVTAPPPPVTKTRLAVSQMTFLNNPASPVQWPFETSSISSGFGKRIAPCSRGCSSDHKGLDFTPGAGTPIAAIADGVVREVNNDRGGFGTHVIIDHQIGDKTITSLYAHMLAGSVTLTEGDTVTVGTTVGRVGNTGASTGAHLHLEIRDGTLAMNPYDWLSARVR